MPWINGEWVDDQDIVYDEGEGPDAYNQFLNPGTFGEGVPTFLPEYNKYGNEVPYDIGSQGAQMTQLSKYLKLLFSPELGYYNSLMTGAPTFDYEQLIPGGGIGGDARLGGPGGTGMGGGGFGGGGGGGGGVYQTPYLNSLKASSDPAFQGIYEDLVTNKMTPGEMKMQLAKTGITDQGQLDVLYDTIDKAWTEVAGAQVAAAQPGPQRELSPMEQWLGKTGAPNPLQGYTADNVPIGPEVQANLNSFLQGRAGRARDVQDEVEGLDSDLAKLAKQMRTAQRAGRPEVTADPTVTRSGGGGLTTHERDILTQGGLGVEPSNTSMFDLRPGEGVVEDPGITARVARPGEIAERARLRAEQAREQAAPEIVQRDPQTGVVLFGYPTGTTLAPRGQQAEPGDAFLGAMGRSLFERPTSEPPAQGATAAASPMASAIAQRPPYLARIPGNKEIDLTRQQQQLQKQRKMKQALADSMTGLDDDFVNQGVRKLVARKMQSEGRTPQRDALNYNRALLQQMGLRI